MLNKAGGKVRLTFKLELDQVWIGTKERTDKIPMNSIKSIVSEPIEGFEQYHVMVSTCHLFINKIFIYDLIFEIVNYDFDFGICNQNQRLQEEIWIWILEI